MMDVMTRVVIAAAVVVLAAGTAYGQDVRPAAPSEGQAARLASLADLSSAATVETERPSTRPARDDDPDDDAEKGTWDNIKRGFFAGLVVGGLVGAVLTAECGHPECGPILPFVAGVGGAIGLGLDALIDRPCDAVSRPEPPGARHATGPRVTLRLKARW